MFKPPGGLLVLLGLSGCANGTISVPDPVSLDGGLSWYGVIGPLVASRCASCHRSGDIAPFPLETYPQFKTMSGAAAQSVSERRMPPFPPDQSAAAGCPTLEDVRKMSEEERRALLDWVDAGAPEGVPRDLPPPKPNRPLGDPTDRWAIDEPYISKRTSGDDYRCFVVRPNNLVALSIAAVSVEPDQRSIVHHASVWLVPPAQLEKVRALEAQDPEPGYECFGGVGLDTAYPTGFWVPGNDAPPVPPDGSVGGYLSPGWAWVVQIHYNLHGPMPADRSSVVMWRGNFLITQVPHDIIVGNTDFSLPPNARTTVEANGRVTSKNEYPALNQGWEGRIYAVWGHQHPLGTSLQLDLIHSDGSEQCLLHIPRWDFHWQSIYRLENFVSARAGDTLRARCTYDNTSEREVRYGEGTADEMCFASAALLDP
jgi:hypothetical protein